MGAREGVSLHDDSAETSSCCSAGLTDGKEGGALGEEDPSGGDHQTTTRPRGGEASTGEGDELLGSAALLVYARGNAAPTSRANREERSLKQ